MHRRSVWGATLLALGVAAGVALLVGWAFGAQAGWSVLCICLLAMVWWHASHLATLARWVHAPLSLLPQGSGVWHDVLGDLALHVRTLHEQNEYLAVALERHRAASQAMPDGIVYLSARGEIEWLNGCAEQHFGLDHARDVGVRFVGLVRSSELMKYLAEARPAAPLLLASPRRPDIRLHIQLASFGEGQKMLISRDVTQLERLATMRQDFIANVSHELRTPLTVIGGFLETIQDGYDDLAREDCMHFLELALEQSTRMRRLIDDLLTLSALETVAPVDLDHEFSAAELVGHVLQDALSLSAGRHVIDQRDDGSLPGTLIIGNEQELFSAFSNLATNAVRYTPAGGEISISWRRNGEGAVFEVMDNGPGIDPAHIPRLTERFFRVDKGRSRETGGTGLGLAIVKHIAQRHQITLHVESVLRRGSRFALQVPQRRLKWV